MAKYNYRYKIEKTDPEGQWRPLWWADVASLSDAKAQADEESADLKELGYPTRECELTVTDRAIGESGESGEVVHVTK